LPPGWAEARDEAELDRVFVDGEDDRDCRGRRLCRQCRNVIRGDDHSDPAANQIGRKLRHPLVLIVGEAVYDCNVVAFYIGGLLQALAARRGSAIGSGDVL
jgi:hypothetical protein